MTLPVTSNNITYEVSKHDKRVFILPISGVNTEAQAKYAKNELEARFITFDVIIQWQRAFKKD